MLDASTAVRIAPPASPPDVVGAVRAIAARELAPIVRKIDAEGFYPETALRAFGRAGAFAAHLPDHGAPDLVTAIRAMAAAGEHCLSTSFCMWCQDALGWYIYASANEPLKASLGRRVAAGEALGGTALSNPMKTFFGIEPIRLKARRKSPASCWKRSATRATALPHWWSGVRTSCATRKSTAPRWRPC